MEKLGIFIGVMAALVVLMVPFVAAGVEGEGPFYCDESVSEVFWLDFPGACYELKASCKGSGAGVNVFFERDWDTFSVYTDGDPNCSIASTDCDQGVSALKGSCSLDDGQIKLELKRNDSLCPVTCEKPDKDLGCPAI